MTAEQLEKDLEQQAAEVKLSHEPEPPEIPNAPAPPPAAPPPTIPPTIPHHEPPGGN